MRTIILRFSQMHFLFFLLLTFSLIWTLPTIPPKLFNQCCATAATGRLLLHDAQGNLFSTMTSKEVFVLIMTNGGDDDGDGEDQISQMGGLAGTMGDMDAMQSPNEGMAGENSEVVRVEKAGHEIHRKLYKVTTMQDHLRARENRHRKTVSTTMLPSPAPIFRVCGGGGGGSRCRNFLFVCRHGAQKIYAC